MWAYFSVKSIGYDSKTRTITSLEIQDKFGNVRFSMGGSVQQSKSEPSQAVKARRAAKANSPAPAAYQPMSEEMYWKIVAAYAQGKLTKTGGDYKMTWIETTHAGAGEILKFDNDVENWRAANFPVDNTRRVPAGYQDI